MGGSRGPSERWSRPPPSRRTATRSSRSSTDSRLILVGRVAKAHGIRGDVLVRPFSENPYWFRRGAEMFVGSGVENTLKMRIEEARRHRDAVVVRFQAVPDRNAAEALRGTLIFIDSRDLEPLEEDAFWEHQLVGLMVVGRDGRVLGEVAEVLARPQQDLWKVVTGDSFVLLPAARQLVVEVDVEGRRVIVDPPQGLFDAEGEE